MLKDWFYRAGNRKSHSIVRRLAIRPVLSDWWGLRELVHREHEHVCRNQQLIFNADATNLFTRSLCRDNQEDILSSILQAHAYVPWAFLFLLTHHLDFSTFKFWKIGHCSKIFRSFNQTKPYTFRLARQSISISTGVFWNLLNNSSQLGDTH